MKRPSPANVPQRLGIARAKARARLRAALAEMVAASEHLESLYLDSAEAFPKPNPELPDRIAALVCEKFGFHREAILGKGRQQHLCWPRHLILYLTYKFAGMTSSGVGLLFGRDHGTVLHACDVVRARSTTEPLAARQLEELEAILSRPTANPTKPIPNPIHAHHPGIN